jgi:hypothetical protein
MGSHNDDRLGIDPRREAAVLFALLHRREGETVERLLADIRCSADQESFLRANMGIASVAQFEGMLAYRRKVEARFLELVEREEKKKQAAA